MRRRFWLVMLVILTILVIVSNVSAQSEDFPETIFDYRVAYLIAEDAAEPDSMVSAATLNTVMGAIAFTSWDDFITAYTEQAFEVVFIHDSMKDEVDRDWTSVAYRKQIMFIGVNMRFLTLTDIVDDLCIGGKKRATKEDVLDYAENSYLLFTYNPYIEHEQHRELVNRAFLEDCSTDALKGLGMISPQKGIVPGVPQTIEDWEWLAVNLALELNKL